ncbi:MAG: replicative DNA helicase [Puniceicoccales bacterium]|jgi:replicative DNA helicase|nr:replicative DNA helicase [Puniceicoccales bacterium]
MVHSKKSSTSSQSHRVPPYSIDFEQALLASCILEGGQESILLCLQANIQTDSFYLPAHQTIFKAISELFDEGKPISELILSEKLSGQGELENIGGRDYIDQIASRIDTPAHVHHYVQRVRDLKLVRQVIHISTQNIENAYAGVDDIDQFIEQIEQSVFAISQNRLSDTTAHIQKSLDSAAQLISKMLDHKGSVTGIPSGFIDLDKMTFGFHPSEMIVVAARPSIGKTSLALSFAKTAVAPEKEGQNIFPTLFFSLEMSANQLAMRLLCSLSGVNMTKLKDGHISRESQLELNQISTRFRSAPLWIDESANMTILEMRAKARRLHNKHPLGLIIIDYLQLISGSDARAPREQQIAEISRGIKAMAKELSIPVVVLSQLNRDSEKERRQPRLSDLRESGSIEQDADVVLLLARRRDADELEELSNDTVIRELIIAKQRNGPVGIIRLAFRKNLTKFDNYTETQSSSL